MVATEKAHLAVVKMKYRENLLCYLQMTKKLKRIVKWSLPIYSDIWCIYSIINSTFLLCSLTLVKQLENLAQIGLLWYNETFSLISRLIWHSLEFSLNFIMSLNLVSRQGLFKKWPRKPSNFCLKHESHILNEISAFVLLVLHLLKWFLLNVHASRFQLPLEVSLLF